MFYFLQEKNNSDRVSFYTPQLVSSMVTQALLDELDDSQIQVGKQIGPNPDNHQNLGVKILLTPSLDPAGKDFSEILYSLPKKLGNPQLLLEPIRSNLSDWGKTLAYGFEARKPRPIPSSTSSATSPWSYLTI